ncbi:hypothetical protein H5410_050479 [Solanum commersonii]|uniref:Uncharacterized protein n=1 Tax=Solanum commersonii TaxID=4109 RepID=A0A9J5WXQ1_SOLCO|nr:hypothetical protein H5410_050479 [Solanum commersonii]
MITRVIKIGMCLYMVDIAVDGSRPILRINVIARSPIEPTDSFNDNDSVENENMGDQTKESFCDQSNDNLGDDSMNGKDHLVDVEDQLVDVEDFEHFEESELQLLLAEAATRKSFDFSTVKSCTKYLKVYNHAHHGYCMRHLRENLWVNHHYGYSLYLYYNATKAYYLEEFNDHFVEFKDKFPEAAFVLEHEVGFEK